MGKKSHRLMGERLRSYLVAQRTRAGLRQVDLAKRLRRYQSYVTYVETGQKIVNVVELIEWAEAIGFDPRDAIKHVMRETREQRDPAGRITPVTGRASAAGRGKV